MGYTQFSKDKVQYLLNRYQPKHVIDLGDQNDYSQPILPAPFISGWFELQGIEYTCIDLNGGNGALLIDLSKEFTDFSFLLNRCDMLFDCGVSEHVGNNGTFDWEAIYNCWKIKHELLKRQGVMYSENPKTGNWPGHGFNYYTQEFYYELCKLAGYEMLEVGVHPACNNYHDGWNVYCSMIKQKEDFITLEQFKKLPLKTS